MRYRVLPAAIRLDHGGRQRHLKSRPLGHGPRRLPPGGSASTRSDKPSDQPQAVSATQEGQTRARATQPSARQSGQRLA
jgi:hypothetical protein